MEYLVLDPMESIYNDSAVEFEPWLNEKAQEALNCPSSQSLLTIYRNGRYLDPPSSPKLERVKLQHQASNL